MSRPVRCPAILLLLLATVPGCGSRGGPLPPLRPVAPAIPEVRVDQRGVVAIIQFLVPPPTVFIDGVEVPIEGVELLMTAGRYPAMTPDLLAVALDDERRTRLRSARVAAAAAAEVRQQQRLAEELRIATERAVAAGEEPPTLESLGSGQPEDAGDIEPGDTAGEEPEAPLSEEEILLRRVPTDYLRSWRNAGLEPATLLEAARRLDAAVDLLWDELDMPTAIVDRSEPPALPDPERVIRSAQRVSRTLAYEGTLAVEEFVATASVVASASYAELTEELLGTRASFAFSVGIPSPGTIRTRYYFAVRAVTDGKYGGAIDMVLPLAPVSVPVSPAAIDATVVPAGVQIRWTASAGDVWGERLRPDMVAYNVYRRPLGAATPIAPLNPTPLSQGGFTDATPTLGQRYVYEVRPLNASLQSEPQFGQPVAPPPIDLSKPRREGTGVVSEPVYVVDTFPPAKVSGLVATRAATRITLRWVGPAPDAVAGYRVYRHQAPTPRIPRDPPTLPPAGLGRQLIELVRQVAGREVQSLWDLVMPPEQEPEPVQEEPDEQELPPLCPPMPLPPVPAPTPPQLLGAPPDAVAARPRRRSNVLVRLGWELVTPTPLTDMRFIDPTATGDASWVYLVEAADETGNVGLLACVGLRKESVQ